MMVPNADILDTGGLDDGGLAQALSVCLGQGCYHPEGMVRTARSRRTFQIPFLHPIGAVVASNIARRGRCYV